MLVIKILIGVAIIFALYVGATRFNQHCSARFGHAFFTKRAFYATLTALAFIVAGNLWRDSSIQSHGDTLNGVVLMLIGVTIACVMIVANIRRTNIQYGIGGSVVQLGLFFLLAWIALPLLMIGVVCQFLAIISAKPVYVVNR
ncbi:hypothetical protein [Paraburkholderia humisilvae]|uniref:Uncharacterized protein n=1 Tax=Paraburkholderia humisilvae TaxID=627669 RepID=A0A6J5DAI6_9BURK|nr:hypothetical protein [Paraburkholderia humisilvae]CAB3751280.1 hypothetical protein LMG29542_01457 [Paraburkholderia humisilvae]